jgi:hypothetical protein
MFARDLITTYLFTTYLPGSKIPFDSSEYHCGPYISYSILGKTVCQRLRATLLLQQEAKAEGCTTTRLPHGGEVGLTHRKHSIPEKVFIIIYLWYSFLLVAE